MGTATIKTDNAFLRDKIELRVNHLPAGDLNVLDCFSGKGVIWKGVERLSQRPMRVLPIDTRSDIDHFRLDGMNQQFLKSLDLTRFNVIDLDAYGVPYEQLRILFDRKYLGVVYVTFIQTMYGRMPPALLREIGFSQPILDRVPILCAKRGWDYFKEWLATNGVRRIHHRSHQRKHYLAFTLEPRPAP